MNAVEIICKKRDGIELSSDEIQWMVNSFVVGRVAPEQMSAFCMAVLLAGMTRKETSALTSSYVSSGTVLKWNVGKPTCDKHSTGGVGDKVTLALTPIAAACGIAVPQLSGRGLGHTGGTLDKLESIPGWRCDLGIDEMRSVMGDTGAVIAAASSDLAPADKIIYALRDVTGTVESIPLIAASIMSKKIAEGTSSLVLDVKTGSGAFMKNIDRARELAEMMVGIGSDVGMTTTALITDMDRPLGKSAGNAVEVYEAVECLSGGGPGDLREITLVLAEEMVRISGLKADPEKVLDSGEALAVFEKMITAQGGDMSSGPTVGPLQREIVAGCDGLITGMDAMLVGTAAWQMGAGRSFPGERIDYGAGVTWSKSVGERVQKGDVIFRIYGNNTSKTEEAAERLGRAVVIDADKPRRDSVVLAHVRDSGQCAAS